jgi:hypothetical protein
MDGIEKTKQKNRDNNNGTETQAINMHIIIIISKKGTLNKKETRSGTIRKKLFKCF